MGRAGIAYTNKDYESLRRELLGKVPQLTDRWTDFNASDLGVVLLELFCGVGDMLAYYLDAQAAEAFLPTARQRQNVIQPASSSATGLTLQSPRRPACGSLSPCRSRPTSSSRRGPWPAPVWTTARRSSRRSRRPYFPGAG